MSTATAVRAPAIRVRGLEKSFKKLDLAQAAEVRETIRLTG